MTKPRSQGGCMTYETKIVCVKEMLLTVPMALDRGDLPLAQSLLENIDLLLFSGIPFGGGMFNAIDKALVALNAASIAEN